MRYFHRPTKPHFHHMPRCLFTVTCMALASLLVGQEEPIAAPESPSFRFGVKVAPSVGSIRADSDELEFTNTGSSVMYGLLGDIGLSEDGHWWLGTGLVFTNIESSFTMDATVDHGPGPTDVDGHMDLRSRYLEIPATLKWRTTSRGKWDFYALFGGSGAFHLQSRVKGIRTLTSPPGGVGNTTSYEDQSVNDDMASFKWALNAGAGVEYSLASGPTFFGGVGYSKAVSSAMQESAGTFVLYGGTTKLYPDYGELSLGVYF